MARKLFVGGLAWATTDESLVRAFEKFGEVEEARVIMNRDTGQSKGFGFVTMATEDAAYAAMTGLNDTKLDGRSIRVSEANEKGGGRRERRDPPPSRERREFSEPEVIRRGRDDGKGGMRPPRKWNKR